MDDTAAMPAIHRTPSVASPHPLAGAADVHPGEDDWVRFAARDLEPAQRAAMADHIVACAECARTYRAVAEVTRGASSLAVEAPRSRWREQVALAASIVLAVAGWSWLIPRAAPVPAEESPAPAAASPAAAAAQAQPGPAAWAALGDAPDVRLPSSLTLNVRGPSDDAGAFLRAFGPAIAPYRGGRYADAAAALAPVAEAHRDVPEAWFYLGMARLHAGVPADAVEPLRRAAVSAVVGDEARWWEAVALERAGSTAEAQRALAQLCAGAGPDRARACAAAAAARP